MAYSRHKEKVRVTLDLSLPAYQRLEELETLVGASSKADVLRDALQLYEYICRRISEGDKIQAITKNGETETLVIVR
jgi:hypothetical protein